METIIPRQDYGFRRSVCACTVCVTNCQRLSGMIAVPDVQRWQQEHGEHFHRWAMEHLAASPGATVMLRGEVMQIPTLVPRRLPGGRCHWLTNDDRCAIHATAPYGCAVFDCQMDPGEGDRRSQRALWDILMDHIQQGPYSQLWHQLQARGQVVEAPGPIRRRHRL